MNVKKPKTSCGMYGKRAVVIARDGNRLTFRWPCGYERTETVMIGPAKLRRPMSDSQAAFFARYWANGVTYECPKCRKCANAKPKEKPRS